MCHHGDTMCQIKFVYRGAHQWVILRVHGNFQSSSYYGLGCGPDTEIETPNALRSTLGDYVIVGTVKVNHMLLTTSYSESAYPLTIYSRGEHVSTIILKF